MAILTGTRILGLRDSAIVRLIALELAIAIVFMTGFAMVAGNRLDFEFERRNRQLVTREIGRLSDLGDPGRMRDALAAIAKADHRTTPDIVYAFIPKLNDCIERRLDTIGQCAEPRLWTDDVEGEKLDLARTIRSQLRQAPKAAANRGENTVAPLEPDIELSTAKAYYIARRVGADGLLLVGIDRSVVFEERKRLLAWSAVAFLLYVAVAILIAGRFITRMTRRITQMTGALERVAEGKVKERVPLASGGDEIDTLGRHTNAMLDRLAELIGFLRRFAELLEHELGNAMTRIRTSLQNMTAEDSAAAMRTKAETCLRDLDEAKAILIAVGELTRADVKTDKDRQTVDLAEIAAEVVDMYSPIAEDNEQELLSEIDPVIVRGQPALLQRLIANLVDNAIKYAGPGATIRVACGTSGARGFLEVVDNGRGLAAEEWDRVIELGQRGSTAAGTTGKGIGLYFVRVLAAKQRMALRFENACPGVRARLSFTPALLPGKQGDP